MGEMSMGEKISCQATRMGSKLCYSQNLAVLLQCQPLDSGERLKQVPPRCETRLRCVESDSSVKAMTRKSADQTRVYMPSPTGYDPTPMRTHQTQWRAIGTQQGRGHERTSPSTSSLELYMQNCIPFGWSYGRC